MPKVPRKISVKTTYENGKLKEHKDLIVEALIAHQGKPIKITVERWYKKRTNKENRYYWGVIVAWWVKILEEHWGEVLTENDVHNFLKSNLNFYEAVNQDTGEVLVNPVNGEVIRRPKSTTLNTTVEQERYHEQCRQLAFEMFNEVIPLPNEDLTEAIDIQH